MKLLKGFLKMLRSSKDKNETEKGERDEKYIIHNFDMFGFIGL